MRRRKRFSIAVLAAVAFMGFSRLGGAELTLAENGNTAYKVVAPKQATSAEAAAAADLKNTLHKITGADFAAPAGKTKRILVGVQPPCDQTPLKPYERRITTCEGDLYLYGEGRYGNVNAVYDFLRGELGCRWFNTSGDQRIPKQSKLVIGDLKKSLVPSIPCLTTSWIVSRPCVIDFMRRNACLDEMDFFITKYRLHAGQRVIPSGLVKKGGRKIGNTPPPAELFADKAYYKDHPEYFSMNSKGKRVVSMQLCYSNKALRDEFVRNLELMIKADKYSGGRKLVGVGQDDNAGAFCCCPECKALEKKYDHPAGAYYDFLLDLSKRFAEKYPEILLSFLAYRDHQTLYPAKCMKQLPGNLLPSYAPLACDFAKPLDHAVNADQLAAFKAWADIAERMHWWAYPTTYPRPIISYPLTANIHRLAENFRTAHACKVEFAYCQYGSGIHNNFGFNDLRAYLLSELCRDITLDEKAIITEYAEGCYGKAAEPMLKYLAELEKCEAETKFYLRWNPDILNLPYTTGANLIRWERDFDAMERRVADDPRAFLNVRRARYNLDQTLIARWPYLTPEELKMAGDLEKVVSRAEAILVADAEDLCRDLKKSDPEKFKTSSQHYVEWHHAGLDQLVARARGGKPLPKRFASRKPYRIVPRRNKRPLDVDPDAPFNLCCKIAFPTTSSWFYFRSHDATRTPSWVGVAPRHPLGPSRAKNRLDGKYYYLALGSAPVEADSMLILGSRVGPVSFCLSPLFDPKRPKRLYEFHMLIAFAPDKSWIKVAELVAIPLDRDAKATDKKRTVKESVDAFI